MTEIRGYHAHVYYNADTRKIAEGLGHIANRFGVEPRALSDKPRGPHPIRSSTSSSRWKNSKPSCPG